MTSKYQECMKSELDLFTVPRMQTSVLKTDEVAYKPLASLDNATSLEFLSVGSGDTYRDLSQVYIKLQLKIVKAADGTDHAVADNVGVVNNLLHSLFRQCTVYLGDRVISQADNNYAYRAFFEIILSHGMDASESHISGKKWTCTKCETIVIVIIVIVRVYFLTALGFHLDTPGEMENLTAGKNLGLDKRKALVGTSQEFELIGRIHADMLNQSKFLLNNIDLRIVLSLNRPEFFLLQPEATKSKLIISDATLYINHVTVNPAILLAHEKVLANTNAYYPYSRVEVPAGNSSLTIPNLSIGRLPSFILVAFLLNKSYVGDQTKNSFNFQSFNLSSFCLNINGSQVRIVISSKTQT